VKFDRAQLFRYELPLLNALPRQRSLKAGGFIVMVDSPQGSSYGEVADAALTGNQTIPMVEEQLRSVLQNGLVCADGDCEPVKWALSSLLCEEPFLNLSLPLNTLLDASLEDMVDQGLARYTEGFRCFKIKIGESALDQEIARVFELSKILGKDVRFRFDGNRKLSLEGAVEFVRSLKKAKIEYLEEPFADLNDMEEFFRLTGQRIALDESVCEPEFEQWANHEAVCAYVIKPTRLGAKKELEKVIQLARKLDRWVVVTSTFESGIGLIALAKVAAHAIRSEQPIAMGLATGSYFAADLISPPLRPFRGQMITSALQAHLNQLNLEESRFCQRILEWQ